MPKELHFNRGGYPLRFGFHPSGALVIIPPVQFVWQRDSIMAQDNYAEQLGQAWAALRSSKIADAASGFQQILKSAPNHVDALYGLALVHRDNGQLELAKTTFQSAIEIVRKELIDQPGIDRLMMLDRMLQQRLKEITSK